MKNSGFKWWYIAIIPVIIVCYPYYYIYKNNSIDKGKKIILYIAYSGLILFLGFISNLSNDISLTESSIEIEVNSSFNPGDYLSSNDDISDISVSNGVNENKVGEYSVIYSKGDNSETLRVNVIDSTSPKVTSKNVETTKGVLVSADRFVFAEDETNLTYSFVSEPNWNTVGQYKVQIKTIDEGNNEVITESTLIVIDDVEYQNDQYTSNMAIWSYKFSTLLDALSNKLINNDFTSESWKQDVLEISNQFADHCDLLLTYEAPSDYTDVQLNLQNACLNYLNGLIDLNDGIETLSEEKINNANAFFIIGNEYVNRATNSLN